MLLLPGSTIAHTHMHKQHTQHRAHTEPTCTHTHTHGAHTDKPTQSTYHTHASHNIHLPHTCTHTHTHTPTHTTQSTHGANRQHTRSTQGTHTQITHAHSGWPVAGSGGERRAAAAAAHLQLRRSLQRTVGRLGGAWCVAAPCSTYHTPTQVSRWQMGGLTGWL